MGADAQVEVLVLIGCGPFIHLIRHVGADTDRWIDVVCERL